MMNQAMVVNMLVVLGVYVAVGSVRALQGKKKIEKVISGLFVDGLVFVVALTAVQMLLAKMQMMPM